MTDTAVLLCGHGTRDAAGLAQFERLRQNLAERVKPLPVAGSYLEFGTPGVEVGLTRLHERGARRILALPVMIFAAAHVKADIPRRLGRFATAHPDTRISVGGELGLDGKLIAACAERIAAAEARGTKPIPAGDRLLLVIGRGTSDDAVNSQVAALADRLGETLGFAQTAVGYAGAAEPTVDAALTAAAARPGIRRITVFPLLLFSGVLAQRVSDAVTERARRHAAIEFLTAEPLGDHPLIVELLAERVNRLREAARP